MGLRPSVHGNGGSSSHLEKVLDSDNSSGSSAMSTKKDIPGSSPSTSLPPVQRQAWTERGQLLLNFHDVISRAINSPEMLRKCSQIASDMSENHDTTSTDAKAHSFEDDYSAEANLIIENKSRRDSEVRNKTIAVGLCVFGVMRGGRGLRYWMKNAANRAVMAGRYKFDSLPSSGVTKVTLPGSKPPEIEQPTKLRRFCRLAIDVTISTTIALLSGEYLFMPRPSSYIEDMAKLPLVEGKSLYAEIVCPPLLKESKRVLEKYGRWPVISANPGVSNTLKDGKQTLTQEDVSLNIIRKFAENCSKRSKYEEALLQERDVFSNHLDSHPGLKLIHKITKRNFPNGQKDEWVKLGEVMVPSGGVPEDISVDLDADLMSLDESNSDKSNN